MRATPPLSSHRRDRHRAHHFALRISPRDERCRVRAEWPHNLPHEKLDKRCRGAHKLQRIVGIKLRMRIE